MSLIDKLGNVPKVVAGKSALYLLMVSSLLLLTIACSKSKEKYAGNQPPSIATTTLPDATENSPYNTQIQAQDPENDPITYEITGGSASGFLEIDPDTGTLYNPNNIDDSLSGQTHDLSIKVSDNKGSFTERTFQVYVINVEDVSFIIKNITDNSALENIVVDLNSGGLQALTDSTGKATLYDIPDGEYPVVISDNTGTENNYLTFRAGKVIVNKTKNSEGRLSNLELKLIPTTLETGDSKDAVLVFLRNCIRTPYDAESDIKKWGNQPIIRIYTREFSNGDPVPVADIDRVKNWILNEVHKVDPLFTYTESELVMIDSTRPVGPTPEGYFDVTWNDGMGALGTNCTENKGYELIAGYVAFKTGVGDDIVGQELTEVIIGSGEPNANESELYDYTTILDDPTTTSNYTPVDFKLWKIHQNRPPGNKDYGNGQDHYHDVNPSDYTINP